MAQKDKLFFDEWIEEIKNLTPEEIEKLRKDINNIPVETNFFSGLSKFTVKLCKLEGKIMGLWYLIKYKIGLRFRKD
jgi:hypothetical protein